MTRFIAYILVFLSTAICRAGVYSPKTLPLEHVRQNTTRVVNPDKILSSEVCDTIDQLLLSLDSIGAYGVVAVCEHFEGDDPYEFAIGLGRELEIGTDKNQGFVIALATLDRSYWISTGEGMEKFMTDAVCSRIERRYMVPYLKQSDWNNGVLNTVKAIHGYITGNTSYVEELSKKSTSKGDRNNTFGWLFYGGVAAIVGAGIYTRRKERKCPHCNKAALKVSERKRTKLSADKYRIHTILVCGNCGNVVHRDHIIDESPSSGIGVYGGGIGGHSHGGGGGFSGGGGFGGLGCGSFGGGGAGGRF